MRNMCTLGSILFMIKIDKIATCLSPEINQSLYVDNNCICYSSKNISTIEKKSSNVSK